MLQKEDNMPYADFGEKLNFNTSQFTKLKSKGDKIRFRILGRPYIDGKHFTELEDGKWDVKPCPRINENGKCEMCDRFFSIIMKAKKTGDKTIIDAAKKEARPFQNSISVYYPVINRDTESFGVFQTTMGIREEIEAEAAMGTKVLEADFQVLRTEIPGKYYKFVRMDSKDTPELTEKELEGVEKFKTIDLADIVNGTADNDSNVAIEENSEVEDVVNF